MIKKAIVWYIWIGKQKIALFHKLKKKKNQKEAMRCGPSSYVCVS
jgi:hypothetical protein